MAGRSSLSAVRSIPGRLFLATHAVAGEDTPPAGQRSIVAREDGFYDRDASGVERPMTNVSASSGVPYFVDTNDTFSVPINYQSLFTVDIEVLGVVDLSGILVEV